VTAGRATSSVHSGVVPEPRQKANVQAPSGTLGERLIPRILITPPEQETTEAAGDYGYTPLRIGYLLDYPSGEIAADIIDSYMLGFEDAMNEGRLTRPIELITEVAVGLPTSDVSAVLAAHRKLVDEGCLVVLGPGISDNAMALRDQVEELGVPTLALTGTSRFAGEHCFALSNGGHGEEPAVMASYLRRRGLNRVAVIGEVSAGDREYRDAFRVQADANGLQIVAEDAFDHRPGPELEAALVRYRDVVKPDALVYCGFGLISSHLNPILERIGWNPPKVMSAAFMWAVLSEQWLAALEGWVGIEQTTEKSGPNANPNYAPLLDRFEARFSRRVEHVMIPQSYDMVRAVTEALRLASIMTPGGVRDGFERIKMMASATGGPRTNITFGPHDHRGYKGDYLVMKRIEAGSFLFEDYHWPEYLSNGLLATANGSTSGS
jgi:branched-chain amino acid transport system substrate-binding protein